MFFNAFVFGIPRYALYNPYSRYKFKVLPEAYPLVPFDICPVERSHLCDKLLTTSSIQSMYGVFTSIWLIFVVNDGILGKYTIYRQMVWGS